MKDIVIIGAGGFGREVVELIDDINLRNPTWNIIGFVDDNPKMQKKSVYGLKVIGDIRWLEGQEYFVVNAIGDGELREKLNLKLLESKNVFATLIHPSVISSPTVKIGEGSIICAGNIMTTDIKIGKHVVINLSSTIGHDAILEDYVTILPGTNISGFVKLKKAVTLGTGTQVIQGLTIGEYTIVGAGSTVIRNLPGKCTAVGSPAKIIKVHN